VTDAHEQKRATTAANSVPQPERVASAAVDAASSDVAGADGPIEGGSPGRQEKRVSQQTVERLSVYRKVLEELDREGVEYVHSQELAPLVGVTPAQLRRDLASFGTFGNIARGYNVYQMSRTMSRLLGTDTIQTVALFGVGDLGRALLSYRGFEERGFHIGLAFDVAPDKIGRVFAGRRCYALDEIERLLPEQDVRIALLACRAHGLQLLVDRIARAGVSSFVNFVPKRITPPAGGRVEDIDIAARMEKLSFLAKAAADPPQADAAAEPAPRDAAPGTSRDRSATGS
jgi:redox-sensing transcriptional repressor